METALRSNESFTAIRPEARTQEPIVHSLGWNVSPEDLDIIPKHWLTYAEPAASLHLLIGTFYTAFMVCGLIGNGLVIWIFATSKSLRTPSNLFVINLAVCDFLMMSKIPMLIYNSFKQGMALGSVWCEVYGLIGSISGIGASITNAFISYDRYSIIANPMNGKMKMTKAIFCLIFIWCYILPWSFFPYFKVWGRFVPEGFLTTCSFDYLDESFDIKLFVTVLFTFTYVIPIFLILFNYSRICAHVFSHEKALKNQAKKMNVFSIRSTQKKSGNISNEIRITKAAITMCFLFVLSWTPYSAVALIGIYGDKTLLTPVITMIPAVTCKLVACFDPYVYAISHPKYRVELQKRLPWLPINEKQDKYSDSVSMNTTFTNTETTVKTTNDNENDD
ncbi:opsin, ultraviolet-sensitive-like [Contarinia nasturtii]|uniref:opsin, ultraviolet-sensitive-like n=1 Tax=Contarinia nasturtii TaxID=265458 RepID=UPI0012D3C222|nr:opsin, ultraviolet-sensitive-like [Contarinia nasturtii]